MLAANRELTSLWGTGRHLVERQECESWGKSIVDRLVADIEKALLGIRGYSPLNVWRMRAFFLAYRTGAQILAQAARELLAAILSQAVTELSNPILPHAVANMKIAKNPFQ